MKSITVIGIVGNSVFLPVENFHTGGETVEARGVHYELGGKGFNQAVAAARSGTRVSFIGAVGGESEEKINSFLMSEGIIPLTVRKDGESAFAAIVTDRSGANRVTVYQGVQLDEYDVEKYADEIAGSDALLINNEVSEEVNRRAVAIARKAGVKVILNPAPYRPLSDVVMDGVDVFTPNEHETVGLDQASGVIVTLGSKGCLIRDTGTMIPAYSHGETVDSTGAGDTFNGVLAAMLVRGENTVDACAVANLVAGVCVTRKHAVSSIPSSDEITEIIKNYKESKNAKGT